MMHCNDYSNYEPQQTTRRSSLSSSCCLPRKAPRRRLSMTLSFEDGSTHDLTNLSYKANVPQEELFPSKDCVKRFARDIPDHHTIQLWQPLPRAQPTFHRANTTTTCTRKEEERTSRAAYNCTIVHTTRPKPAETRRPSTCREDEQLLSPPVRSSQPAHQPRRMSMPTPPTPTQPAFVPAPVVAPTPTPAAPSTIPSVRPEPGPRPKVNYKKLYGLGGEEEEDEEMSNSSRNRGGTGMGSSRRRSHLSFQEQQLQRTLQEEERLRKEEEQQRSSGSSPAAPVQYEAPEEPSPRPPDMGGWQQWQEPQPKQPEKPHSHSYRSYQEPASYTPSPQPQPSRQHQHGMPSPPPTSGGGSQTVMEIAPNLFVPYKGSHETWEAVQRGQFTVTTCFACTLQLVVIDTAEFLVCPDCHTVSPLSYSGDGAVERCGVGLGIKREWCDTEAALPANNGGGVVEQQQQQFGSPPPLQPYPTTERQSRPTYEQRHHEKQAKYHTNERSPSPEQEERYHNAQRRSTFML